MLVGMPIYKSEQQINFNHLFCSLSAITLHSYFCICGIKTWLVIVQYYQYTFLINLPLFHIMMTLGLAVKRHQYERMYLDILPDISMKSFFFHIGIFQIFCFPYEGVRGFLLSYKKLTNWVAKIVDCQHPSHWSWNLSDSQIGRM